MSAWILRESLSPALWSTAAIGSVVSWRGGQFKVMRWGTIDTEAV